MKNVSRYGKTESLDQAIEFAENEASQYSHEQCDFLGFLQAYEMSELAQENGIEVFSLLRESNLESEQYLDFFFDTSFERQGKGRIQG